MANSEPSKLYRSINQSLGRQPSLGPIPANLFAPSGAILISFYVLFEIILRLGFAAFLIFSIWGIATWWIAVGEKTWKFTNKFVPVPNWKRGFVQYCNLLRQTHE